MYDILYCIDGQWTPVDSNESAKALLDQALEYAWEEEAKVGGPCDFRIQGEDGSLYASGTVVEVASPCEGVIEIFQPNTPPTRRARVKYVLSRQTIGDNTADYYDHTEITFVS